MSYQHLIACHELVGAERLLSDGVRPCLNNPGVPEQRKALIEGQAAGFLIVRQSSDPVQLALDARKKGSL